MAGLAVSVATLIGMDSNSRFVAPFSG